MNKNHSTNFSFDHIQKTHQGKFQRDQALKPHVKRFRIKSKTSESQQLQSSTSSLTSRKSFRRNLLLTSILASQTIPTNALISVNSSQFPSLPNHLNGRASAPTNLLQRRKTYDKSVSKDKIKGSQQEISQVSQSSNLSKFKYLCDLIKLNSAKGISAELKIISKADIIEFLSSTSIIIDLAKNTQLNKAILDILDLARDDNDIFDVIFNKLSSDGKNILFLSAMNNNQEIILKIFEILDYKIANKTITDQRFYDFVTNFEDSKNNILTSLIKKNDTSLIKLILEKIKNLKTPNLDLKFALLTGTASSRIALNSVHTAIDSLKLNSFKIIINHFKYDYKSLLALLNSRNHNNHTALFFAIASDKNEELIFKAIAEAFHDDPDKKQHLMEIVSITNNKEKDSALLIGAFNGKILLFREILSAMSDQLPELIKIRNLTGNNIISLPLYRNNFDFFNEVLIFLKSKNINLFKILSVKNINNRTPLMTSTQKSLGNFVGAILVNLNSIDEVISLLSQELINNDVSVTPSMEASFFGDLEIFDKISFAIEHFTKGNETLKIQALEKIFIPLEGKRSLLQLAIVSKKPEIVNKILSFFHSYPDLLVKQFNYISSDSILVLNVSISLPVLNVCISNKFDKQFIDLILTIKKYCSLEQAKAIFTKYYESTYSPLSVAIFANRDSYLEDMLNLFNDNDDLLYDILLNTDKNGNTPLIQAVIKGNYDAFEVLFLKTIELANKIDSTKIDNLSVIKALTLSSSLGKFSFTNLILSKIESSPFRALLNKSNLASCITHLTFSGNNDEVKKILQLDQAKISETTEQLDHPIDLSSRSLSINPDEELSAQLSIQDHSPSFINNSLEYFIYYLASLKNIDNTIIHSELNPANQIKIYKYQEITQMVSPDTQYTKQEITADNYSNKDINSPVIIEVNDGNSSRRLVSADIVLPYDYNELFKHQSSKIEKAIKLANDLKINELAINFDRKDTSGKLIDNLDIKLNRNNNTNPWKLTIFGEYDQSQKAKITKSINSFLNIHGVSYSAIEFKPKPINENGDSENKIKNLMNRALILLDNKSAEKFVENHKSSFENILPIDQFAGQISEITKTKFEKIKADLKKDVNLNPPSSIISDKNVNAVDANSGREI